MAEPERDRGARASGQRRSRDDHQPTAHLPTLRRLTEQHRRARRPGAHPLAPRSPGLTHDGALERLRRPVQQPEGSPGKTPRG